MLNEVIENVIKNRNINILEQRKIEGMKNNFLEALNRYRVKEEISMKDMATVDRIEGKYAVCELLNGEMVDIDIELFKEKISEGDIFDIEVNYKDGQQVISVGEKNEEEMNLRREIILEKLNKIKNK